MTKKCNLEGASLKRIEYFELDGRKPFLEWLEGLDVRSQKRIQAYIGRIPDRSVWNNIKPVGLGVYEIRIHTGPGYRVYFGESGGKMIFAAFGRG
jgi:putative addiction module killer protein